MLGKTLLLTGVTIVLATTLSAQETPYAGLESRAIKALSPSQVEDLLEGRGMSLALAAELNSYPGPRHVIDMADSLNLSGAELARARDLFDAMAESAQRLGVEILQLEGELDALFVSGQVTAESVADLTARIGEKQGLLRSVHLSAHLEMRAVLSDEQVARYDRMRGYGNSRHEGMDHDRGEHQQ